MTAGVLLLQRLMGGRLPGIAAELGLYRPRGYGALPLLAAAVLYFASPSALALRPFFERMRKPLRRRLGAMVKESSFPTSSSLSRALGDMDEREVRPFLRWLLGTSLPSELLTQPSVQHHDAMNAGWHVVDIDPTVLASRRRELPEGPDLPPGERRAPGEAGYTGRKRGEARMRLVPALHEGSGMWLSMVLLPKEGSVVPACRQLAKDAVVALRNVQPDARVALRGDGEFGSAGAMRALADAEADFVCRLPRSQLLRREDVSAQLAVAQWYAVPPGESGVPRQAAELGTFTLRGSKGAEDADAVITVRVVVTRVPRSSSEPDRGVIVDGHQLELFATSLDPAEWPTADLVRLFHGRASIENRFAQSKREFDLERTFSYTPAGQEWMCGVALFLWNELITMGWEMADTLPTSPTATPRPYEEPCVDLPPPQPPLHAPPPPMDEPPAEPVSAIVDPPSELAAVFASAFADVVREPGWTLDPEKSELRCPQGRALRPYSSAPAGKAGPPRLLVRTDAWACDGCPIRESCFTGSSAYKSISRSVSADEQRAAAQALQRHRIRVPSSSSKRRPRRTKPARTDTRSFFEPPVPVSPGPYLAQAPQFLPAAARSLARRAMEGRITLRLTRVRSPQEPAHPLIASSEDQRAHRRRTRSATSASREPLHAATVRRGTHA